MKTLKPEPTNKPNSPGKLPPASALKLEGTTWVALKIGVPFRDRFTRVPPSSEFLHHNLNLENCANPAARTQRTFFQEL